MRVAIVGCGRIASKHAAVIRESARFELAAVCDIQHNRATDFGHKWNAPAYTDLHTLLEEATEHDIYVVSTDSGSHAEVTCQLAKTGKPVIVEKPMALTLEDADRMITTCAASGSKLFVVKQNRWNLAVQALRGALDEGRFGRHVSASVRVRWCRTQEYYDQDEWRGTWARDGGVVANQASHHLDILLWMLGDVETVFAFSRTALADIEVEDTAVVALRFVSGALATVEVTTATRPRDLEGSFSLLGEKGTVEVSGFALNEIRTWMFASEDPKDQVVRDLHREIPSTVYGFGHTRFYEHVAECHESGVAQMVDGLEGRKSLELVLAIYESIETGLPVRMRFRPERCRLGEL